MFNEMDNSSFAKDAVDSGNITTTTTLSTTTKLSTTAELISPRPDGNNGDGVNIGIDTVIALIVICMLLFIIILILLVRFLWKILQRQNMTVAYDNLDGQPEAETQIGSHGEDGGGRGHTGRASGGYTSRGPSRGSAEPLLGIPNNRSNYINVERNSDTNCFCKFWKPARR